MQVSYSNLYGNIPEKNFVGDNTIETLNGNLSADPIYVNSGSNAVLLNTTSSGSTSLTDVRLSSSSPLIDSGDNAILDPDNTVSDVGAWGGPNADNWDLDGDGFAAKWEGDTYVPSLDIALGWDCDDSDARVYPYASDILGDDLDTNCDGLDGIDSDFDGFVQKEQDCDDSNANIHPDADEICDTLDNNCDDVIDTDAIDISTWYLDIDGDSYGHQGVSNSFGTASIYIRK